MILRDYQIKAVDAIWGAIKSGPSALMVAACGSGKTEIMMATLKKAIALKPDLKVVVLVQKLNLLDQTERRFKKEFTSVSKYCGEEKDLSGQIVLASIQSIEKLKIEGLNCIVVDEAHNLDQDDGRYKRFIDLNQHQKLKIIGFTATPMRSDGHIYGKDKLFSNICYKRTLQEQIDSGYLVRPSLKKPLHQFDTSKLAIRNGEYAQEDVAKLTENEDIMKAQVTDALFKLDGRKKIVWACASIKHCEMVYEELRSRAENASMIHSKMSNEDRDTHTSFFQDGEGRHLVFVTIVSEGWDYPPTDAVVLLRPTRSAVLYVQTVGRALRIAEGKTDALVLDYGNVVATLGPLDNPKILGSRRTKKEKEEKELVCPKCFEYQFPKKQYCPKCDYKFYEDKPKDFLKSLTTKSESNAALLSKEVKPKVVEIQSVRFSKYISKNGNPCLRVDYEQKGFIPFSVSEYFSYNHDFGYKNMQRRMIDLHAPIADDLDGQVNVKPGRIPKSIEVIIDNGFEKVSKLNFI